MKPAAAAGSVVGAGIVGMRYGAPVWIRVVTTAVGIFIWDTGEFTRASAAEIGQLTIESHGVAHLTVNRGVSAVVVTTLVTLVYVVSTVGVLLTVPFGGTVLPTWFDQYLNLIVIGIKKPVKSLRNNIIKSNPICNEWLWV